jgi:hypothetical protein
MGDLVGKNEEQPDWYEAFGYIPPYDPMCPFSQAITPEEWETFFFEFAKTGVLRRACSTAHISPTAVYYHKRKSPLFALRLTIYKDIGGDALEEEAFRRAVEGVNKDIFWQGGVCGTETVYSDSLLSMLLKGAKPDKYKDRVASENVNLNANVPDNDARAADLRARIASKLLKG